MSGVESYYGMFRRDPVDGTGIRSVEIPLIQRDYAQGRRGAKVDEIRRSFLEVLRQAVDGDATDAVSLDFIYGELVDGILQPLDGQQRLTTLFLLHWYLASRAGRLNDGDAGWTRFSYATRPSARRFTERLALAVPPIDVDRLSEWIVDQAWYLYVWQHDPTIDAMLVTLDAIHGLFRDVDAEAAWHRLTDEQSPAVWFHLLPLPDMGSPEDLYIKMNSRGKPLTDFENLKAQLEKTLETSPRAEEFAARMDVEWSDILWRFRGDDDLVDDEFLRYLEFVIEICEWRQGYSHAGTRLFARAERVFGAANPRRDEHVDFLFDAFDVWKDRDVDGTFSSLFRTSERGDGAQPRLFFRDSSLNLFESCCRSYGRSTGTTRIFTFGQTLVLFATVLHLAHDTEDFPRRARVLRNLIEGSQTEMRTERMSRLVADTRALIVDGVMPPFGSGFSRAQIDDETAKQAFLDEHPDHRGTLERLEDHDLLKGSTSAFELQPSGLLERIGAFETLMALPLLWKDATAALITVGDYHRAKGRDPNESRNFQFATSDPRHREVWRTLLIGATRDELAPTRAVVTELLDRIAEAEVPGAALREMCRAWLAARESEQRLDWRYYMVKYPSMREGGSGIYFAEGHRMGYSLCNLRGGKEQMNSNYRDPYLLAIWRKIGEPDAVHDPWFIGYEWNPRVLTLTRSGAGIRVVPDGFELWEPTDDDATEAFFAALNAWDIVDGDRIRVPQTEIDDERVDSVDRVELGAAIVRALIESGL